MVEESATTQVMYREMGLNESEYQTIVDTLHRPPTVTELGMYAVMWSEHCGYKYSRPILALFKTYREAQLQGALENAGVVPLDSDLGIVFKVESHNHPSAVEPFQGAATGVGGILRDIFTMGARPIACLNSLRFGPLEDAHNRYLFEHVVAGIGHYGNCVGVPTVAGEVYFHPCYSGNPLVNAMAAGVVRTSEIAKATAKGVGNPVVYVGSSTGKDGIHGATFASVELSADSESKRPNVQMGDPFMEKLLIEATLEALATGHIVGIQDMGAAGLTCATCETAAKGGAGMEIDVRAVPLREAGMSPYEVMLSESQERMLCIVERGHEQQILDLFHKWELNAAVIGSVTDDGYIRVKDNGAVVAELPAKSLADGCPTYRLETQEPDYISDLRRFDPSSLPEPTVDASSRDVLTYTGVLADLLDSPSIAGKLWVTQQYDSMVQTQTVALRGADAAILRIRGTSKGIALKLDGNGRYGHLDPYAGGQIAVVEAARNVACVGARPAGITDCLNFANPEKPDVFWQFLRTVEGIASAADGLEIPVVSGNVSFYNETPQSGIFPTPVIGMLGVLENVNRRCEGAFRDAGEGDLILLLTAYTDPTGGLGGSEYLARIHGKEAGVPPSVDVPAEKRLQDLLVSAIGDGLLASCHDVSDGGLSACLAECAITGKIGAAVLLSHDALFADGRPSTLLFGEAQGRVVATVRTEKQLARLTAMAQERNITTSWIGTVGGSSLRISLGPNTLLDTPVDELGAIYYSSIARRMEPAAD